MIEKGLCTGNEVFFTRVVKRRPPDLTLQCPASVDYSTWTLGTPFDDDDDDGGDDDVDNDDDDGGDDDDDLIVRARDVCVIITIIVVVQN